MGLNAKWSPEEDDFLRLRYPYTLNTEEISDALGRSLKATRARACKLGLHKVFGKVVDGKKYCPRCVKELPLSDFNGSKSKFGAVGTYCKKCTSERNMERVLEERNVELKYERLFRKNFEACKRIILEGYYYCEKCKELKPGRDYEISHNGDNIWRRKYCLKCKYVADEMQTIENVIEGKDW